MKRNFLVLANCVALIVYVGLAIYAGILLIGCTPPAPATHSPSTGSQPPAGPSWKQKLLDKANEARARVPHCQPLALLGELNDSAQNYAMNMAVAGQLTHTLNGESFADRMGRTRLIYSSAGENIAEGYNTVDQVFDGWMASPGHRANILDPAFTHVGAGAFPASCGRGSPCYWCQQFVATRPSGLGRIALPPEAFRLPDGLEAKGPKE